MTADTATRRTPVVVTLWRSTIGKKIVMAATGLLLVGFLLAHMAGNLKVFEGAEKFNAYGHWLRTIGEPVLPYSGFLWIQRLVLLASVVVHVVAAVQLTRRSLHQRSRELSRKPPLGRNYVAFTMRSGGVVLALFVVWHLLDMTTLTVNPRAQADHPYQNLVASFSTWYGNVIYLLALTALGYHLWHGVWSAAYTLGMRDAARLRTLRQAASILAIVVSGGFAVVPIAVMVGVVR